MTRRSSTPASAAPGRVSAPSAVWVPVPPPASPVVEIVAPTAAGAAAGGSVLRRPGFNLLRRRRLGRGCRRGGPADGDRTVVAARPIVLEGDEGVGAQLAGARVQPLAQLAEGHDELV